MAFMICQIQLSLNEMLKDWKQYKCGANYNSNRTNKHVFGPRQDDPYNSKGCQKKRPTPPQPKPNPPASLPPPAEVAPLHARVAVAASFDPKYLDGARVLAQSVKQHMSQEWPMQMYALIPPKAASDLKFIEQLKRFGYIPVQAGLKFKSDRIKGTHLREAIDTSGCCGMAELSKLEALRLTQFEWVLLIDADALVLKNLDKLLEAPDAEVQYTLDTNLKGGCINGGFALMRPSQQVYDDMWSVMEEGDWRATTAWGGTGIGYCYGGPTFQGLVPYFYQHVYEPTKSKRRTIVQLDSGLYNNQGLKKPKVGRMEADYPIEEVATVHFTFCQKPWRCVSSQTPICKSMHEHWWKARNQLEKQMGYPVTVKPCDKGQYVSLPVE
eukprot:TRINITY_DN30137_c0_g1_i1.p1 TRINITY_DN30137_c0_g1~~TRINITY_DN30137_c0_g1_i1.p1  ORF type:complete len:382 (-),score=77.92 TRINITY_DN30137_c0_g1_i1:163-1308(-)